MGSNNAATAASTENAMNKLIVPMVVYASSVCIFGNTIHMYVLNVTVHEHRYVHMHIQTHTHPHIYTHTRIHTQTHTHKRIHTRAHTHTYTKTFVASSHIIPYGSKFS